MEQDASKPPLSKTQLYLAHGFLVYAQCAAIMVYTLGKRAIDDGLSSSAYVVVRLGIALPFMLIASFVVTKKILPERKYIPWMVLSGILSIVLTQALLAFGLARTTATNASIISAPCNPLFTTALSIMLGKDKMSWTRAVGFVFSVAGALTLLQIENFSFEGKIIGNLFIMASAISNACNALVQRKILDDGCHPISMITYTTGFGLAAFVSVFSHLGLFRGSWHMSTSTLLQMFLVGIAGTFMPWNLGSYALKGTSPMTCAIYVVLQPPLSALLGLMLGEQYTWHQGVGSVLVLTGLFFVNFTEQAKRLFKFIRERISSPSHKEFQVLKDSETESNLCEMKIMVADGASFVEGNGQEENEENEKVYTFKESSTNDIVEDES